MPTWGWILIGAMAVVVLAVIVMFAGMKRREMRSGHLQRQFKSEYAHVVSGAPSRRDAETELARREERHEKFDLRPLPASSRQTYADRWQRVQARFVDDPGGAVRDADRLVEQVMAELGYPAADFEQRAADVSVQHPDVVASYRSAHDAYASKLNGATSTEELRNALVDYRTLMDELLADRSEARDTRSAVRVA